METYKLNDAGTHIEQQPEMEYPTINGGVASNEMLERYHEHIANRKKYILGTVAPPEWKGKELVEDKDFKLKFQVPYDGTKDFYFAIPIKDAKPTRSEEAEIAAAHSKKSLAKVLKEDANGRDESQKILWIDVLEISILGGNVLEKWEQNFTIQRK